MKRRVLITGGRGMFATDMVEVAQAADFEVTAPGRHELDVTNWQQTVTTIEAVRPDIVVHTVGLLVDPCESDPELAHRVHVWGTGCVARACDRVAAVLVNLSTCGLFGDERRFYAEYDSVVLKTRYAASKFQAEREAERLCARVYNVRPGWLFGGSIAHKKNFVYQRYLEARKKLVLRSASDKFGSPTYTRDLASALLALVETERPGVYHVTNTGGGSRHDYVTCIVQAFGLTTHVEPVDSSHFRRAADVPSCELLENCNVRYLGLPLMPAWEEALSRYVATIRAQVS